MKSYRIEQSVPWWRNAFINGSLGIWQRGGTALTLSTSRQYRADRFYAYDTAGTTATVSQSAVQLPANGLSDYSLLITGGTGTTDLFVGQRIESFNARDFKRHQYATFSAWVYNGTGSAFVPVLSYRTPTVSDTYTSMNTDNLVTLQSCANGAWTQVYGVMALSGLTNVNYGLQVEIKIPSGSLDTSGKLVYLSQLMLNPGNEVAPFMMASGWDIEGEIRKCQRYYEKSYNLDVIPGASTTSGALGFNALGTATNSAGPFRFIVLKRAAPVVYIFSPGGTADKVWNSSDVDVATTVVANNIGQGGWRYVSTLPGVVGSFTYHFTAAAEL